MEFTEKKVQAKDLCFAFEELDQLANEDGQGEKKKAFTGTAYSGLPIMNHPFWGNLIFDVNSMKAKDKVPVLINHDMNAPAGHARLSFDDNRVTANGVLYGQHGNEFYALMTQGFPMQESVYIEPDSIEEVKAGQIREVNGQEVNGPMTIFHGGMIKEVSLTPLGADSNTSTTAFNGANEVLLKERVAKMAEPQIIEKDVKDDNDKKFNEDTYAIFLTKLENGPKEAFEFACCDSCEGDKDFGDENAKLKEEVEKLKKELKEYRDREDKRKREEKASKVEETYKEFGLEAPETLKSMLVEAEDEKFTAALADIKTSLENKVVEDKPSDKLFNEDKADKKFTVEGDDEVKRLQFASRKLRAENPGMSLDESFKKAKELLEKQG